MGRYALVLGTATYHADRDLAPLPAVQHDVQQIKAALDYAGGFDAVDACLDLPRSQLTGVVEEFFGARRRGDLALLYYSGHGLLHHDRESLFLATTDTLQGQLHATAVDVVAVLKDMLSRTYATHKVVLLDCCFSGAFTAGNRFRGGVREEPRGGLRHAGTFILTSSNHVRASFAQGPDRPSVFTEMLLDGLRGGAQPRGGSSWITTHDLAHYVQAETLRRGSRAPCESSEGVTEPIPIAAADPSPAVDTRPRGGVRSKAAQPGRDAPFDADRWRRLIHYYMACVERSAVLQSFVDVSDKARYEPIPAGPERVFTGTGEAIRLPDGLAALARRTVDAGSALRYGYPVVVRRSASGRQQAQFAPLLECDASIGPDGRLHATLPPRVNAALARERGLSDKEVDEVTARVEETFVAGDSAAVVATIHQLTEVLGVPPAVPINPAELSGTVQSSPLRRVQNTAVLLATDAAATAEAQLLEDLRQIATRPGDIARSALAALADAAGSVAGQGMADQSGLTIVAPDLLNEAQEKVIQSAMTSRLTVAQGPPGTGKSQLVTALVATATAAGQTVLVGSTNNRAVSEVSDRCTDLVGPGLIVRSGNKEYLSQEPKLLSELIARHRAGPVADQQTPAAELRLLRAEVERLRSGLDSRRLIERDLAELAVERRDPCGAAFALPVDELALRRLVAHADRGLRHRILGWLSRRKLRAFGVGDREQLAAFAHQATVELRWQTGRRAFAGLPEERIEWQRLQQFTRRNRPAASRALLSAQIATRVRAGREILQRRCEEMSGPKPRSWSRFGDLLTVLPAWAVTAMSARKLPPTAALFDLVVIDEAAACTVPAVLPLLYRAKRALIIGDPRQLSPVVPLPPDEDARYQQQGHLGLDWLDTRRLVFTSHSAYDAFAAAGDAIHLLDEHYRCHPEIVAAPNREVYQSRLVVLTDAARLVPQVDTAVVWRHVPGQYTRGSGGSGYNTAEITATVAEIVRVREQFPEATVGVVTPLAAQALRLRRALSSEGLSEDDVTCGTVHRFQGGQRDIMVISAVGANGIADRTCNWLVNQANLWNVAITRAKAHLIVVGDQSWWAGRRGMLAAIAAGSDSAHPVDARSTPPADALHAEALAAGLAIRRDAQLSGHQYDLVIAGWLAVLVDDPGGDPDGRSLRTVLARLDVTGRGHPVRRVPAWRCLAEPATVIEELVRSAE